MGDSDSETDPLHRILRKRCRPQPNVSSVTTEKQTPVQETPTTETGFRLKKRLATQSQLRKRSDKVLLDFMIENPLDGKLKDLPCIQSLMNEYKGVVFMRPTSYCHHGYAYQKRTVFIGTLPAFNPTPPCPTHKCKALQEGKRHESSVAKSTNAQKNSIPESLVIQIVDAWLDRVSRTASRFLLIDVFSGFGSVSERIRHQYPHVNVYANDIVNRSHVNMDLDMTTFSLGSLLILACSKVWDEEEDLREQSEHPGGILGWMNDNKIAALFHISTPCETYSTNAIWKHRVAKTARPKSKQAARADALNERIVDYLRRNVLV